MGRKAAGTLRELRPDIADQLVDLSLGDTLSVGSNSAVEWKCEHGHVWTAKVYNRTNAKNKTGCPYCDGKRIWPGFNDLATTHPEVAALCVHPEDALTHTASSNKKIEWQCGHGHVWTAPVSRLTGQGSRCPYCSGRLPIVGENDLGTTHSELADQLVDQSLRTKLQAKTPRKVEWQCAEGHVWSASVYSRTQRSSGCPYCHGRNAIIGETDLATTHPGIAAQLVDQSLATRLKASSEAKVEWQCEKNPEHRWFATVGNRTRMGSGCPICANKAIIPGENDIFTTHPYLRGWIVDEDKALAMPAGSHRKLKLRCKDDPSHEWYESAQNLTQKSTVTCPFCAGAHRSLGEVELEQIIRALCPDSQIEVSNHTICNDRREIDIVVWDKKIAFEFNGVRWHCDKYLSNNNAHKEKFLLCENADIQLIQVWDDDWRFRKEVVVRMVAAKLQATDRLGTLDGLWFHEKASSHVGARKCRIELISGPDAISFLEENHIQGKVTATYHFGLVDSDGDIRALLSVRSPRNNARMKRQEGEWEVQRYATLGVVSGGFTRLLKHAEEYIVSQGHELTSWISFSANDVSNGAMYRASGFELAAEVRPDYKYVGNYTRMKRAPKEGFQKKCFAQRSDLKFEEGLTELELADLNDLYRIYDAGKRRWVKSV